MNTFGTEQTPAASFVIGQLGGIVSKSAARKRRLGSPAMWDGAPRFHPAHNVIYSPSGEMPDVAAQALFDAGLINESDTDAMWRALYSESATCIKLNESASVSERVSKAASALGKLGRGRKKTMSQAAIHQRKAAALASVAARFGRPF